MEELSVQEKREFIQWVLNNYTIRRKECVWILNYLVSHDEHLVNVVFIQDGTSLTPFGLHLTDHDTHKRCKFYFQGIATEDMDKAFHAIRGYGKEHKMYIRFELNFKPEHRAIHLGVLDSNPYLTRPARLLADMSRGAEAFLYSAMYRFEREHLHMQIDEALVSGDKELFIELTARLKETKNFDMIEIIKDNDRFRVKDGV